MTDEDIALAAQLWRRGKGTLEIGAALGLAEFTIYTWIQVIKAVARIQRKMAEVA